MVCMIHWTSINNCIHAVFGLGTLIFIGLEIAMHATMNKTDCVDNIVIAHPILQVGSRINV